MRISTAKSWLAIALSLRVGAVNGNTLTFQPETFVQPILENTWAVPIFNLAFEPATDIPHPFRWYTTNGEPLRISKVNLYLDGEPKPLASGTTATRDDPDSQRETTSAPPSAAPSDPGNTVGRRDDRVDPKLATSPTLTVELDDNDTRGSVSVSLRALVPAYNSQLLYFGLFWPDGQTESFSRAFAIVNDMDQYNVLLQNKTLVDILRSAEARGPKNITETPNGVSPGAATSTVSGTEPTDSLSPSSDGKDKDKNGGGGLPKGAIIGIAVACGIIGLALIIFTIWFLLRRRQAANDLAGAGPYGAADRSRADELMAEKEASAGTDHSPHSPYSDEGGGILGGGPQHQGPAHEAIGIAVTAPHRTHDQQGRSYTPYSDRGSGGGGMGSPSTLAGSIVQGEDGNNNPAGRGVMGSPTSGRGANGSSLAPRYAHLVEEGMTEDEIRRLEDEERQLDAAIEQAGRRS